MNYWKFHSQCFSRVSREQLEIYSQQVGIFGEHFISQVTESDNELGEVNMNHNLEKQLFYLHAGTVAHIPTFS